VLIIGGTMGLGPLAFWLIVVSILIKSLAGGKHRAELAAVARHREPIWRPWNGAC
jgi:hypothetical protein